MAAARTAGTQSAVAAGSSGPSSEYARLQHGDGGHEGRPPPESANVGYPLAFMRFGSLSCRFDMVDTMYIPHSSLHIVKMRLCIYTDRVRQPRRTDAGFSTVPIRVAPDLALNGETRDSLRPVRTPLSPRLRSLAEPAAPADLQRAVAAEDPVGSHPAPDAVRR